MALTTAPFKFLGFRRSLLTLSPYFLVKFQHSVSADTFKAVKCRDEDCDDFLPWLEKKAGMEISSVLSIGISKYGRSLFASKNIEAGDCPLKVPFHVQISPDNMLPEIKSLIGDEVGHTAKLAVVILHEQRKGQDSEWAPYISRLPKPGDMHSTIFWSDDELEMIRQSPVFQDTVDHRAQIRQNYLAIKPALDSFPEIFDGVTFDDFRYAYGSVSSRAWGSVKGLSLIPFADFLNHDGTSQSVVLTDEHRQISEVVADRNYIPGDEVLIRYGKFPNSVLLLDFGFTVPFNIYDEGTEIGPSA
uniref:SET domain-containing protein n=1 Tax=Opuntia streptacantha TaxID=393608 RepID=A0A7C9AA87_OPUST